VRRFGRLEPVVLFVYLSWLAPESATAGTSIGPSTAQALAELERDTVHRTALTSTIDKARRALTRAHAMDQAGDARHAAALRAVAREWVGCGNALVRTSDAEARADKAEKTGEDLETKRARGRALLEETIARRGRAQALLDQLDRETQAPPPAEADAKAKKPAPKPAAKKPTPVNE
jgi:hypothetical protein